MTYKFYGKDDANLEVFILEKTIGFHVEECEACSPVYIELNTSEVAKLIHVLLTEIDFIETEINQDG